MQFDVAHDSSTTRVRSRAVRREVTRAGAGSSVFLVVNPIAPPRLWRWITDDVCAAIDAVVAGAEGPAGLIDAALDGAADAIARIRMQLIEPELIVDAQIGLLVASQDSVHAALSSGIRLYRARGGVPERLWTRMKRPPGVASRAVRPAMEPAQTGDLFVLGTRDTFTVRAIGNLAATLARANRAPARELCEAVVGPCRDGGIGAAAVVLRAT